MPLGVVDAELALGAALVRLGQSRDDLVRREALNGSRVEIGFDAPTREWSARQNTPTVSLYLYDIREDLQRREVGWEPVRGPDRLTIEHRQPPRRFRLSYLITCWTQRPEDEHRLLSSLLACFLRYPVLPADVLAGSLPDSSLPLLTTIALPPPADRSIADVWSALGGELKPSLDLVITAPMDVSRKFEAAPPVIEHGVRLRGGDASEFAAFSAGGRARPRRRGRLLPTEAAMQEETIVADRGEDGPSGKAGAGKGGRAGKGVTRAGQEDKTVPGRRIRLRGISRP